MKQVINDPGRKGELAAPKRLFGKQNRYAVAPVHTRFDNVVWYVWDAEKPDLSYGRDPIMGYRPSVIRTACSLADAVEGLA